MKLADWLKQENMSAAEFARRSGISEGMVSLLCRDSAWLSKKTARAIHRQTGGAVTPNDFFSPEAVQ